MVQDNRITFALAQLQGRLHRAVGDKRCGCAACAWWVAMAAQAAGVPRKRLENHLLPPAVPHRKRKLVRPMTARICDSGTIRDRGAGVDAGAGIALLLSRLHESE